VILITELIKPPKGSADCSNQHAERTKNEHPDSERIQVFKLFEKENGTDDEEHVSSYADEGVDLPILSYKGAYVYKTHLVALQSLRRNELFAQRPVQPNSLHFCVLICFKVAEKPALAVIDLKYLLNEDRWVLDGEAKKALGNAASPYSLGLDHADRFRALDSWVGNARYTWSRTVVHLLRSFNLGS
jgi:hypothetical protein